MSFLDLTSVQAQSNDLLPAGVYLVKIANAEVKDTKDGTGQYISTQLKVIEGEHEGRSVFNMFNIKSAKSEKAVEIGLTSLKSMLFHAGAPFTLNSVGDIVGYDVGVKIGIKNDSEYGDKNVVKGFTTKKMLEISKSTGQEIPF